MRIASAWPAPAEFMMLLLLIGLLGCSAPATDFSQFEQEGSEVRVYEVFGMDCPGCHGGLEKLVNAIPGIRTSKANWEKQRLHVVLQPETQVDDSAIHDAIKRANFTPGKRIR
ncbi:MAG: heavy-metal-associated domain-containing protein [Candidatus Zixiibacteriota bacterium]|nr:MAG: heavy-metal-associated domain-containing protein [candidate division Zixibacteria bacterium]